MKYNYSDFYCVAKVDDIDAIMEVIEDARLFLKEEGNGQWQDGYPDRCDLLNDIKNERLFVIKDETNTIAAVCAITYYEEDYSHLYEGKWKSDYDYCVMHRVAVRRNKRNRGYGKKLFEVFIDVAKIEGYHSLRIDTHKNNKPMLHLFELFGFEYCGKVILKPNKDRVVYEKIIC